MKTAIIQTCRHSIRAKNARAFQVRDININFGAFTLAQQNTYYITKFLPAHTHTTM